MAVVEEDDERQPLLTHSSSHQVVKEKESWLFSCIASIRSSWSIYQIVLLLLVYQISYFGQVSSMYDIVRDLTCSRFYEQNPDQIDPSDEYQCSSDLIESQSAQILLVIDVLIGLGSAIATIQFGKKFSVWGRKPVLIISLISLILFPLASIVIPRGYPYGPLPSEAFISPTTSIYILGIVCAVTGLLGGNTLPLCCFRLLVVDHSDTADRTKNLLMVQVAYMSGVMIGPLVSAAASYFVPIYAVKVDEILFSIVHRLAFGSNSEDLSALTNTTQYAHGNVTPFILCIFGGIMSIIYVIFFVKETAFLTQAAAHIDEDDNTTSQVNAKASTLPITPLRAIFPIKRKDGTYDMRITALFSTMLVIYCGVASLEPLLLFFGHAMGWSPTSVGYIISSLGGTRIIIIFGALPPLLVYLERNVRKPTSIAHLTVEDLHKISKWSSSEEVPVDASAFASEADLDETRLQQGAISLWRAKIDRSIILISWSAEIIGWLVIAIGATIHHSATLLIGTTLTALGTGGTPALQSFGLTVTSDVLAGACKAEKQEEENEEEEEEEEEEENNTSSHHGHAGEIFFSILAVSEGFVTTFMPIINNLLYSATLTSFPAACFLLSTLLFLVALAILSTIDIHRHQ